MADSNIPTPDEITRVTEYLQTQAAEAQETIIAAKKASAETAQQAANNLVQNNDVVGVAINRRAWDDETIHWEKRGDIESIRLDFADGTQATLSVGSEGDYLDLLITPASDTD
jgi:hypothetical protein